MKVNEGIKILIVEDDRTLARKIAGFLGRWGYETRTAEQFDRILEEFEAYKPQLVLLDIQLPFYDGFYWCGQIRQVSQVPVIYISSRSEDSDKIMAIAQGGDDYVEKPFSLEILKTRIEAMVRRTYQYRVQERTLIKNGLYYDALAQSLIKNGAELELGKPERKIIDRLLERRGQVVSREELMMTLWNTDEYVSDGALTTVISRLRNKLKSICGEEIIDTRKGQGYRIL